MCGLAAIYNLKNKNFDTSDLLDQMMNEVKNRGPDSYKKYISDDIELGHRRLSIIDLKESANQPFQFKDRYYLIFNGAIYNYLELKKELSIVGYKFYTNSDTEVLIASYDYWGENCLNRFNGMWAFIIWDKLKKVLFTSRDRFGIKPIYYSEKDGNIFFASEIKQLRKVGIGSKANMDEISKFIYTGLVGTSYKTCFESINQIPPGYNLIIKKNKKIKLKKWYDLFESANKKKSENIVKLIDESIKLRTRCDVDLGILLSGGIDSSFLTRSLNLFKKEFKIFHSATHEKETNELFFAKQISQSINKKLNIKIPTDNEFWNNINKICYLQDEPFGSPSIFMQFFILEEAKKHNCKVILDGQGADEIFLGYKRYMALPIFNALKSFNIKKFIYAIVDLNTRNQNLSFLVKIQYIFGQIFSQIRILRMRHRFNFINLSTKKSKEIYDTLSKNVWDYFSLQYLEIYKYSLPSLLRFADRNSMHNSIELRVPFLDHRVVEECITMSLDKKIKNGWDKFPLRNSGRLIKQISLRESKLGFASPSKTWINKYSKEMYKEISNSKFLNKIINSEKIKYKWKILNHNEKWRLFNLAIWSKKMKIL